MTEALSNCFHLYSKSAVFWLTVAIRVKIIRTVLCCIVVLWKSGITQGSSANRGHNIPFTCIGGSHIGFCANGPLEGDLNLFAMVFENLVSIPITMQNFKNKVHDSLKLPPRYSAITNGMVSYCWHVVGDNLSSVPHLPTDIDTGCSLSVHLRQMLSVSNGVVRSSYQLNAKWKDCFPPQYHSWWQANMHGS